MEHSQQLNNCTFFSLQDNVHGLDPSEDDQYADIRNCVLLSSSHRARFIDFICDAPKPFLCEVPVEESAKSMV